MRASKNTIAQSRSSSKWISWWKKASETISLLVRRRMSPSSCISSKSKSRARLTWSSGSEASKQLQITSMKTRHSQQIINNSLQSYNSLIRVANLPWALTMRSRRKRMLRPQRPSSRVRISFRSHNSRSQISFRLTKSNQWILIRWWIRRIRIHWIRSGRKFRPCSPHDKLETIWGSHRARHLLSIRPSNHYRLISLKAIPVSNK